MTTITLPAGATATHDIINGTSVLIITPMDTKSDMQFQLTTRELRQIGFTYNRKIKRYTISTINGFFYYNPSPISWYHRTCIGDTQNDVLLNIPCAPALYAALTVFRVSFRRIAL